MSNGEARAGNLERRPARVRAVGLHGLGTFFGVVAFLAAACSPPGGQPRKPPNGPPAAAVARAVLAEAVCDNPRVRVQVTEVARAGADAVSVKFRLVNPDAAAPVVIGDAFADASGDQGSLSGVYLTDEAGRAKLFVLRDDQDRPQCSTGLGLIPPGGQVDAWGRYPAPAGGATRLTVQVPRLPAFRGLPIAASTEGTGQRGPS